MSQPPEADRRRALLAAAVASLALVATLWVVDYLPTNDGPQHIFIAYLDHHLHDAGKGYATYFVPNLPVTSLGFGALFGALESSMPWRPALSLTLSLIVLAWAWGFFWLCSTLRRERWVVGLFGFVCALQWGFYMGLFSWVLSTGLTFALVALAQRRWPWGWRQRVAIGGLLTIQALVHVFGAEASGLLLGLMILFRARGRERWRELGLLLVASSPTLAIAYLSHGAAPRSTAGVATAVDLVGGVDRLLTPGALFFGGPMWRRWPLVLLSLAGLVSGALRARAGKAAPAELALLAGGALFLAAGVASPLNLPGWDYFSPRFLPLGLMLPIALLPAEELAAARRTVVLGAVAIFALANLAWLGAYHRELRERAGDALAGLDEPLSRAGTRLPIVLNPHAGLRATSLQAAVPFALPLRNIGALYALEQGGYVPYLFANNPSLHGHLVPPDVRAQLPEQPHRGYISPLFEQEHPAPLERAMILDYMLGFGARYDDVILSGEPADVDAMLARGFVAEFRRGGAAVARFVGCPTKFRARAEGLLDRPMLFAYGWHPSPEPYVAERIPVRVKKGIAFDIPGAPCGEVWLRFVVDRDESGELTPGDLTCDGADADGLLRAELAGDRPHLDCALRAGAGPR